MKIFHVAGGGDRGGAKTHILALCSRLQKEHDLQLISLRSGDFPESAQAAGIRTTTFFSWFVPYDYYRLIRKVRREKPEIVHCHGAKANIAGLLVKLFCHTTVVSTVHSDYQLDYLSSLPKRLSIGFLNARALRHIDYYVTVSELFKQMLISRGFDPLRCMVIYNGLDFQDKAEPFDKEAWLRQAGIDYQPGDVVLGILARLTPVKDIPTLLHAFAQARKEDPRLKLLIGGDGEDAEKLKALARQLKLGSSVSFMGWVTDVKHFFAACDIDVLCSISESFPYSILEGVREGCAVITSDVGGMRRLIEQGESGSFYFAEEILSTGEYKRTIKATDRATMLNLMVGLNGYTLCSGIICEDLNGSDYVAVPFKDEEENPGSKMEIGYIIRKNAVLGEIGETYIAEMKKYLNEL